MAALYMNANSPMTWEIVYSVMCGLAYVSWQYHTSHCKLVVMTVVAMAVVAMAVDDPCLLLFTWGSLFFNQNYLTTSHLFVLWGVAVGTLGHDIRFACLVYFLHRFGHSAVAKYLIQHMSPTWTDNEGMTLLHFACRWVNFLLHTNCPGLDFEMRVNLLL